MFPARFLRAHAICTSLPLSIVPCLALFLLAICPDPAAAQRRALVLIDRTGSMTALRANGNTRCKDAKTFAIGNINNYFTVNPAGLVAVWSFSGTGPTDLTGGFVGQAAALAAVATLGDETCTGVTPLAESMCLAADALVAAAPPPAGSRLMYHLTDGAENASDGECMGFNSVGGPPFDVGSWQLKVMNKVTASNVVLHVGFFGTITGPNTVTVSPETHRPIDENVLIDDVTFFRHAAISTRGSYTAINDSDPNCPPDCPTTHGAVPASSPLLLGLMALGLSALAIRVQRRRRSTSSR